MSPVILTLVLCLPLFAQQEETPAARLARAVLLEETAASPAEALAAYAKLRGDEAAPAELRCRAGMGEARCLARLGRIAEASELVASLEPLAAGSEELARKLPAMLQDLRARAGRTEPQEDPLQQQIMELLSGGNHQAVSALGKPALPILLEIIDGGWAGTPNAPLIRNAVFALVGMDLPAVPDLVLGIMNARRLQERKSVVGAVAPLITAGQGAKWRAVAEAALIDPDPTTREVAAKLLLGALPDLGWEAWQRALRDESPSVRLQALKTLLQNTASLSDDQILEALNQAMDDSYVEIRRQVIGWPLRQLRTRLPGGIEAIVERGLGDGDPRVRQGAYAQGVPLLVPARRKPRLLRGLGDPDPGVRRVCVSMLAGAPVVVEDVPSLRPLLRDPDGQVRSQIAHALSRFEAAVICDSEASEDLLIASLVDSNSGAGTLALSVLARAGSRRALPHMLTALRSDRGEVVGAAVYYLIRHDLIGELPAILEVFDSIQANSLPMVPSGFRPQVGVPGYGQSAVIDWMRQRKHRGALLPLLRHLDQTDQNQIDELASAVRDLATADQGREILDVIALATDTAKRALLLDYLQSWFAAAPYALEYYLAELDSKDPKLRGACARALLTYGGAAIVPQLIARLEKEDNHDVSRPLATAIAKHATAEHVELLDATLGRAEAGVAQDAIVRTLGAIGTPAAVDILLARLQQPGADRSRIFSYLGEQKVERAFEVITGMLQRGELEAGDDRRAALRALGHLGDPAAVPVLLKAIVDHGDRETETRFGWDWLRLDRPTIFAGLSALYDLGPESLLAAGRRIMDEDFDDKVRSDLMQLLAFVREQPKADALLREGLAHPSESVRTRAIQACGQALFAGAIHDIRALVRDPDPNVRQAAAHALKRFVELGVTP